MAKTPYRVPGPKNAEPPLPPDPFLRAWRRLRMWRLLLAAHGVVACALLFLVTVLVASWVTVVLTLGVLCTSALAAVHSVESFQCPGCGKPFGVDRRSDTPQQSLFRRDCAHCGLRIGTPKQLT